MESKIYRPDEIREAVEKGEIELDSAVISILLHGIPISGVLILTSPPIEDLYGEKPGTAHYGLRHHTTVLPIV